MSLSSNAYFSQSPSVKLSRSAIDRSHTHKTTFNNGDLIPIYSDEILPGDTVTMDLSSVVRMSTPIKPIMDNIIMDVYFFFIPNRLVWNHWKAFMGEVSNSWTNNPTTYSVPQLLAPSTDTTRAVWYKEVDITNGQLASYKTGIANGTYIGQPLFEGIASSPYYKAVDSNTSWSASKKFYKRYRGFGPNSLAAYMGFPIGCDADTLDESGNTVKIGMSSLPYRAYASVWNEFFRDQNYMALCNVDESSDSNVSGRDAQYGDHWTGSAISGEDWGDQYTYTTDTVKGAKCLRVSRFHDYFSSALPKPQRGIAAQVPLSFSGLAPVVTDGTQQSWTGTRAGLRWKTLSGTYPGISTFNALSVAKFDSTNFQTNLLDTISGSSLSSMPSVVPSNLYADVESVVSGGTINDLRTAFQVQKFLETYARSGARYTEIIQGFFGVKNPDARLQRPEFLGYKRNYINVTQVLQTSSTDATTPQGNTAAYSLTTNKDSIFTKSFTEHGILLGLCCTRTSRSYQSGINKMWSRRKKYDYYWPQFAHLGEEPINNKEIFCYTGYNNTACKEYSKGVFGYQERYAEYRYFPDMITGDFSSYSPQSLDLWHFGDYYNDAVYCSQDWLFEGPENVDRTLAVTSSLSHQFIADFYFKAKYVRPMPLYSVPGLADHF